MRPRLLTCRTPQSLRLLQRVLMLLVLALLATGQIALAADAPRSLPIPPPPPAAAPPGFSTAETERARIMVGPGSPQDATAFARIWGLQIDEAQGQLDAFLPPRRDKVDIAIYADDAAFAAASSAAAWPEPEVGAVLANPGIGEIAVNYPAFARQTPLEAENGLRHALAHVAAREASHWSIPRGFDEGLAAYFERPAPARLARHAALVQNARAGGSLLTWSELNRPAVPSAPPAEVVAGSYSMIAFLIDRHGLGVLGQFITALSGEPDWRVVLRQTYNRAPVELEAQWLENLPRWTTGGWRSNLIDAFNLQPARDLISRGHYASARRELEQSLRLFTDLNNEQGIAAVGALLAQTDIGLQAETLMEQTQAALELHNYERAESLLGQAQTQYDRLEDVREPNELLTTYAGLAQSGQTAAADLERARELSLRWADYPMARGAALAAGTTYARLGDSAGLRDTAAVLDALDNRQRRLVLLVGGLAILSGGWLALWLWARGERPLSWGR